MMQAKENQQFNGVKENIVPTTIQQTTKGNALQPSKSIQSVNIQNVQNLQNIQNNQPMKSNGLQVSKQSFNQVNQSKMINKPIQNVKSTALQTKSNGNENNIQQKTTKGIQNKLNAQKENGANRRQSLKPIKNEIIDGKIKKTVVAKQNSASKLNKKAKKSSSTNAASTNSQKVIVNNQKKESTKPLTESAKKENECDFVIFCDENDELQIRAVEKEKAQNEQRAELPENKIEKKKGLAERNLKPMQQQQNIQINLQNTINQQTNKQVATSVQQLITQTTATITYQTKVQISNVESDAQTLKSNIELIKEAVVPISNLTLDETCATELTFNEQSTISTIENKENDPTLMSIDLTRDEDLEIKEHNDRYRDVSGDMSCEEFSNEIYLYMLDRELKYLPDANYMSKQPEINSKMRSMLVDWLIDVGIEYELENETVFLAVSYIDQFLSSLTISLQNFQLLGTAALFIASKYEEIYPPELKEFIYVTDDAYTKLQMLSMEKVILKSLNFSVSPPTVLYFLKYFMTKLSLPIYVQHFAEYLCFLSLLHTDPFLSFTKSDIAVSSIILALHTYQIADVIDLDEFKQLTKIHFYKDEEGKISDAKVILIRQSCVNAMYKLHKNASEDSQQAILQNIVQKSIYLLQLSKLKMKYH